MFTLHDSLMLMLLPFALAAAATALAWRRKKSSDKARAGGWAMTVALAAGVLAAGLAEFPPKGLPREAMDALVLLPAMALVGGLMASVLPWWISPMVVLVAGGIDAWVIAMHLAPGSVPLLTMIILAVGPAMVYAALQPVIAKRSGVGMILLLLMLAGATVIVESAGTFIQFGQYTVALPAALAGILLARLILGRPEVSRGTWTAFVLVWTAILAFGYLWADVPALRTGLLAAAPLFAWFAEIPRTMRPFARRPSPRDCCRSRCGRRGSRCHRPSEAAS